MKKKLDVHVARMSLFVQLADKYFPPNVFVCKLKRTDKITRISVIISKLLILYLQKLKRDTLLVIAKDVSITDL
jgi:hypothetical protein